MRKQGKAHSGQIEILQTDGKFKKYDQLNLNRGQISQLFAYEFNAKYKIRKLLQSKTNEEEE